MSLIVFIALFFPVLLGGLSVFLFTTGEKTLKLILAFGGAFLLSLTFVEIIPEIYSTESTLIGLFVMLGFFVQLLLDFLTKGVEHGHHSHHEKLNQPCRREQQEHFSFLGIMIGICIHSFLEGMPLSSNFGNELIKDTLLTGIVIHNIPISIVLVSLFLHTGLSKTKSIVLLIVFALSSPFGTITSYYVGAELIAQYAHFFDYVLAMVVGIFLHISTTILFETDENHRFNFRKFFVIVLGFGATILLSIVVH